MAQSVKNLPAMQETPGSGRSPGEGDGSPLQYSCPENPMDRKAWRATVHEVARVRHNLATTPPPRRLEMYITFIHVLASPFALSLFQHQRLF